MRRLKLTLLFNTLKNNYIIIVLFFIINLLIYKKYYLLIIIDLIYFIYIIFKDKLLALVIFILLFVLFSNILIRNIIFKKSIVNNIEDTLKVINVTKTEDKYKVYFKYNNVLILAYTKDSYEIGCKYYIKGNVELASKAHYKGGFDYYDYLKNQNIIGLLTIEKSSFIKKGLSIYQINYYVKTYIDNILDTKASGMIKALTIGDKDNFDNDLLNNINKIGISHLFVISGLHVNIISLFVMIILNKIKVTDTKKNIINIFILFIYYLISGLLISVLRVILGYFLKFVNKLYNYELNNTDLMMINIILVLLINPLNAFKYSFILSYVISTSIIICSKILNSKGKLKNIKSSLKVSVLSVVVTLPIVIKINPTINLLCIIYNIFYIPFVTYIMLPFSFLTIFIPFIEEGYLFIYQLFEVITTFFANIKILNITFPYINSFILINYYLLLYLIFSKIENKRKCICEMCTFLILLIGWNNISIFNIHDDVYFLDLPKGEATFIKKSFNRCNILIDTGENGYDDIIHFLKSIGIKRLDIIFISHSDSDHLGMLDEIIEEFKVKNIFYNLYDKKTKQIADFYHIRNSGLKYNSEIKIKDIYFKIISPKKDYNDTNNNSLVMYANIFNVTYLLTGDITTQVEDELDLTKYNIDVLKLAHHGSNTSTSIKFLNQIGFDKKGISICMNGYKNTFSFPTKNTVNKIKGPLYITSDTKTLCIRKNNYSKYRIIKNK